MDVSEVILLFICVGIVVKDAYGILPPRYVSEWFVMDVNDQSTVDHTMTHGFGVVPFMHEVQVMSPSGFIYPGVKSGNGDDDFQQPRGGVVCIYNANDVRVFSAYGGNSHLIFTGTSSYTNQNQESRTSANVRVRLWHPEDFSTPTMTLDGIDLEAGNDGNNYEVHAHTLGQVPALTIVQFVFTYTGASWYGEAMGSSNHLVSTSTSYNWGGIVFGVDANNVQLWAPSICARGGVINICDGWGVGLASGASTCFPTSSNFANITIRMWASLGSSITTDLMTSHTLGDSGDSHEYSVTSAFDVDKDLVIVESVAVDGAFTGYHFYATGAAINDGAMVLGGMIYAYNSSAVRIWHPTNAGSYLIKVGEYMGPTPGYAHVSTETNTRIRIWKGEPSTRQRTLNLQPGTLRNNSQTSEEVQVRSSFDCAIKCSEDDLCRGANYRHQSAVDGGVCRLFLQNTQPADLSADLDWQYIHV